MFTVVESIVVVVPSTFKFPVTVTLPLSVGLVGIPTVTVTSLPTFAVETSISLAVPTISKSSANKSTSSVLTVKLVANPVNPLPSPTKEPVNVESPATLPKSSPLTLPVPKSVAWLESADTTLDEVADTLAVFAVIADACAPLIVVVELAK